MTLRIENISRHAISLLSRFASYSYMVFYMSDFLFGGLLQLERVQKRIADRKMKIHVTDAAVQVLGSLGYDPNYGARPVKRVIQQNVENELAKGILRGEFKDEDTILIDTELTAFGNGQLPQQKLVFRKLEAESESTSTRDSLEPSPSTN